MERQGSESGISSFHFISFIQVHQQWLWNSGAAFASWEAVFREQRALGWSDRVQRAAFLHFISFHLFR